MVQGCSSQTLRTKGLEEDKALTDLINMARTMEAAHKEAKCTENNEQNDYSLSESKVDNIRTKSSKQSGNGGPSKRFMPPANQKNATSHDPNHAHKQGHQKCNHCGGDFPHQCKCPAIGINCHYCHKRNDFISVCRKGIKNS